MSSEIQQFSRIFIFLCGPFILSILIIALLSPRFKAFANQKGWTVQSHPKDHRDYLFTGAENSIQWEMEYYFNDHYRKRLSVKRIPYMKVIVWTTKTQILPDNTLLLYPRKDKLIHLTHPRLIVGQQDGDPVQRAKIKQLDKLLTDLPEKRFGTTDFQQQFILRSDIDIIPDNLIVAWQSELLSWSKIQLLGPIILINADGITIWWLPLGMRNEWLEKTVQLGLITTRNLKGMA